MTREQRAASRRAGPPSAGTHGEAEPLAAVSPKAGTDSTLPVAPRPAPELGLARGDQSIRCAKDTMIPSGPRTDAMRHMPSYSPTPPTGW